MSKGALRRRMRELRAGLDPAVHEAARRAARALIPTEPTLVYVAVRREFPTRDLLVPGLCAVPRIVGDGVMEAARYDGTLSAGPFGVPTSNGPVVAVRYALVPGLAFDRDGRRLGYGGGYYDRWLAAHPDVVPIGLAFSTQIVPRVPTGAHDRPMAAVFTERGWLGGSGLEAGLP